MHKILKNWCGHLTRMAYS